MNLDKVLLMNLKRRKHKYWFTTGALSMLGYPPDRIRRFNAHDAQNYDDIKSVHNAAVVDGFPIFSEFESSRKSLAAWYWTWCAALRQIVESNETVLLMIDDYSPLPFWRYDRLNLLVENCYRIDKSFRMLQLTHTRFYHEVYDPLNHYNEVLAKGLAGSADMANVFSPSGAAHLLDICIKSPCPSTPHGSLEILFFSTDQSGLWHTVDEICSTFFDFPSDLSPS